MLAGSWRWNVIVATAGSIIVGWMNMSENPWLTTIERTGFAWVLFYGLAFGLRYIWGIVVALRPKPEATVGQLLDVQTPQEMVHEQEEQQKDEFFMPLFEEVRVSKNKK